MNKKETEKIEFKKSTAELKQALEDICAFANKGEGTLYFGVDDDGKVVGQDVSDTTLKKVSTTILTGIEPRVYPNIFVEEIKGKTVLVVEVKNGPDKPYFYKGKAYKRVGTSNAYLSRYEVEKYLYERENPAYRFDKTVLSDYKEGVNKKVINWFRKKAAEKRNIPEDIPQDLLLNNIGAFTNGKLNLGGILTFGKHIQRYLLNSTVKCAVFSGLDNTGRMIDHLEIRDNVFKAIVQAEEFVLRNIRKSAWISEETGRREEQYEIPYPAIREAIANAVAHRDYRLTGNVDIAVYDDRIDVYSPGELPKGITLKALQKGKRVSLPRNPVVSEALFLTGYIERWGTGINKMKTLMLERGLPEPEYDEYASTFVITLYKPAGTQVAKQAKKKTVEKTVEKIRRLITVDPHITQKQIQEKTGLTRRGVEWQIKKLKENGVIERIGSARSGHWKVFGL